MSTNFLKLKFVDEVPSVKESFTAYFVKNMNGNSLVIYASDTTKPFSISTVNAVFTGNTKVQQITETSVNLDSGNNIVITAGSLFKKTITAATTLSVSSVPAAGNVCSFILQLTNGGNFAVTWWPGIKWPGGIAPTLTSNGTDTFGFYTDDGGATWCTIGKDVK